VVWTDITPLRELDLAHRGALCFHYPSLEFPLIFSYSMKLKDKVNFM